VVAGLTKGNRLGGSKLELPIDRITNGTHLQPRKWVARLVGEIHREGRTTGRLFQRALEPPQLCEFANDFFTVLEGVQSTTVGLISEDFDVREEAGIL